MHPPRSKHARSLHVLVAVLVLAGGLAGCSSSPRPASPFLPSDTVTTTVARDSALAVLSSMRRAAVDSAFASLHDYGVTRSVRSEQMTPSGTTSALRSYVLRYPPGAERGTIQQRDSAGTFRDGGLLGWSAPSRSPRDRPADVASQVLSDEPAFIEPRTREAYRYALRADSLSDGTPVYRLDATARNRGTGRDQSVRYVHLVLNRNTRELIGLTMVRAGQVLLFEEDSRMHVRLQRAPDGRWVPHVTRVRAVVDVPFRSPRQFRTVSAYYEYESASVD